eukprot:scaffold330212_cov70-Tisochrysis_lutea.AAC.2
MASMSCRTSRESSSGISSLHGQAPCCGDAQGQRVRARWQRVRRTTPPKPPHWPPVRPPSALRAKPRREADRRASRRGMCQEPKRPQMARVSSAPMPCPRCTRSAAPAMHTRVCPQ